MQLLVLNTYVMNNCMFGCILENFINITQRSYEGDLG